MALYHTENLLWHDIIPLTLKRVYEIKFVYLIRTTSFRLLVAMTENSSGGVSVRKPHQKVYLSVIAFRSLFQQSDDIDNALDQFFRCVEHHKCDEFTHNREIVPFGAI